MARTIFVGDRRRCRGGRVLARFGVVSLLAASLAIGTQVASSAGASAAESPVTVNVGKADPRTGKVLVRVRVRDADGKAVRLSIPSAVSHGSLRDKRWRDGSGAFTYVPTAEARHAASSVTATSSDKQDRFKITVVDGQGKSWTKPVTVRISPQNSVPVAHPIIGSPNAQGVVTGTLGATDPDGDLLTYTLTSPATKGTVELASDGSFTYTPNFAAGRSAAISRPAIDLFTVTISDGYGGSVQVPVSISG